jgi:single-strand DNA-binding protein
MLNTVILMGRLTKNPEIRQTNTGKAVCTFDVAIDRPVAAGADKKTDFFRCTAWENKAEHVAKFYEKGSMIIVQGSLQTGSYTDKKYPDVTHYTTEVKVDSVSFGETRAAHELSKQNAANRAAGGGYQSGYQGNNQGGYQGGYQSNQGGYQGNNQGGGYQGGYNPAPKQGGNVNPFENTPPQMGGLSDFEEVISDADLPF